MEKTDIKSLDYDELKDFLSASAKSRSGQSRSISGCMKNRRMVLKR